MSREASDNRDRPDAQPQGVVPSDSRHSHKRRYAATRAPPRGTCSVCETLVIHTDERGRKEVWMPARVSRTQRARSPCGRHWRGRVAGDGLRVTRGFLPAPDYTDRFSSYVEATGAVGSESGGATRRATHPSVLGLRRTPWQHGSGAPAPAPRRARPCPSPAFAQITHPEIPGAQPHTCWKEPAHSPASS